MVITLMLALASAFVLSLTFVPAMVALLIRGRVSEREVARDPQAFKNAYEPQLKRAIRHPIPFIAAGAAVFGAAVFVFFSLGRVFIADAGRDQFQSFIRTDSVNFDRAVRQTRSPDRTSDHDFAGSRPRLFQSPEPRVWRRIHAAQRIGHYVILKPKSECRKACARRTTCWRASRRFMAPIVGNGYDITQPIQMRFNELIGGVRSDVAVAVYGDDLETMGATAKRIAGVMAKVPGVADLRVAQTEGFPTFDIKYQSRCDRALRPHPCSTCRYGRCGAWRPPRRTSISMATGDLRLSVRVPSAQRDDLEILGTLPVMLPGANGALPKSVPLRQLVSFGFSEA